MASYLNFDVGGRPYNSQDFAAIQDQVIDATQIYSAFAGGGDYIVSGANVRGTAGTIWLAGKLRAVPNESSITPATPFPLYIVAQDNQISRLYKDGQAKIAFNVFNASWSTTPPGPGVAFMQFNSQTDLNSNRLTTFLSVDAVPVAGGTFTGQINVQSNLLTGVNNAVGIGANLIALTPGSDGFRMGLGMGLYHNGSAWITPSDGSNNGGGFFLTDRFGSHIRIGVLPSTGGVDRFLSTLDINNAAGITIGNDGNISSNGITLRKVGVLSTISFPATSNDPGFIQHEEVNNAAIMRFSVSDDASGDYFTFGSTPGGVYTEAARITTNGTAIFNSTVQVGGGLNVGGTVSANSIAVSSSAKVNNLNADFIDGLDSSQLALRSITVTGTGGLQGGGDLSNNISLSIASGGVSNGMLANGSVNVAKLASDVLALFSNIPAGVIVMWSGSTANIPTGWALCNGGSGTPNLLDRFIMAAGGTYAPNTTGGSHTTSLTVANIPSHNHTLVAAGDHQHYVRERNAGGAGNGQANDEAVASWNEGSGTQKFTNTTGSHTHTVGFTGSGTSFNNIPAYWALCYIMKL